MKRDSMVSREWSVICGPAASSNFDNMLEIGSQQPANTLIISGPQDCLMYQITFHSTLRSARKHSQETLRALAGRCGVVAGRLTRLERGLTAPTHQERQLLANAFPLRKLELLNAAAHPPRLYQGFKSRGLRFVQTQKPFYPPRDRESRVRLAAAKRIYPVETASLLRLVESHPNLSEVNAFCEKLSIGSSLECLFITTLFAQKAEPANVAPAWLAPRTPLPAVCPKTREPVESRPFPCIVSDEGLFIPQVTFAAHRLYTVDFLRFFDDTWSVVELDGKGHDPHGDSERTLVLGLPVLRLTEKQVLERAHSVLRRAA